MTAQGPPFYGVDWDDDLEVIPQCAEILTKSNLAVELWLKVKAPSTVLTIAVVEGLHRVLFQGLFPEFAGRLRGEAPRYLPINVDFGNRPGTPYQDVLRECLELFMQVERYIHQLDHLQSTLGEAEFAEEALKVACYTHCELIRIHPFRNGNGRTARTCINYFARRYGRLPVPFERPKGDYIDANRSWLDHRRIEHMMNLLRPYWQGSR